MKLVWHIIKKDLRALRWPLVVWVALIAAKLGVGLILLTSNATADLQLFNLLDGLVRILAALEVLGVVMVAALIHQDMLMGSTAFWATRPISRGRLLTAKLLGLGIIFGVIPVLVTLPWWLACHLGLWDIAGAAVETLGIHFLVVLLGLLLAVVTDGLGRFLLWTLALVAAIPLTAAIIGSHFARVDAVIPADLATTRTVVVAGVALLGISVVVAHQFLTRRTWRSVSGIGATGATILMIALWWPWSWGINTQWENHLAENARRSWPLGEEPPGLTFSTTHAEIRRHADGKPDRPVQLWVNCQVQGVPANQRLVHTMANNYTLRWTDGMAAEGWAWFRSDRGLLGMNSLQILDQPSEETTRSVDLVAIQNIPAQIGTRLWQESAVYSLEARFTLVEAGARERLPLTPGPRSIAGTVGERVASVEKDGEELVVGFVRHRPALIGRILAETGNYVLGVGAASTVTHTQYLLVNHEGNILDPGVDGPVWTSRVAAVNISWATKTYRAMKPDGGVKPRWAAIKALDEAELTRLVFSSIKSFAHRFEIEALTVSTATSN
jgi:hypothetical protein